MEKRRPTSSLSLFTTLSESFSSPNPAKSPRSFENGVFGLGIVAAMTDLSDKFSVVSPISSPIPIVSCGKATTNFTGLLSLERENDIDKVDELDDESYTCVISHDVGNNLIKKRVYYFGGDKVNDCCGVFDDSPMMNVVCQVKREFWTEDFLTSCHHCNKLLHGLDIFMYRGEKAFCSSECRDNQIRSDDHKEKCGSGGRKPLNYSISPCSGPLVFFTGVVAA